jgi:hypothetical protein
LWYDVGFIGKKLDNVECENDKPEYHEMMCDVRSVMQDTACCGLEKI